MNLVAKLIFPLVLSLLLIALALSGFLYILEEKHQDKLSTEEFMNVSNSLNDKIEYDTMLAKDLLHLISTNKHLKELFESKNKAQLFLDLNQSFLNYKNNYGFSHFYIHEANQTNYLRLHNKEVHSDVIDRITLKKAVETNATAVGIEFGVLHNLTLRIVTPWFYDGKLIGYLELGKDVDNYIDQLSTNDKTELILLLSNSLVDNKKYTQWKKHSENKHKFTQLEHFSITNSTIDINDSSLLTLLDSQEPVINKEVVVGNQHFHVQSQPILDVNESDVGKLYLLYDHAQSMHYFWRLVIKVFLFILLFGGAMMLFYIRYIKQIDSTLRNNTKQIAFNYLFEKYVNNISQTLIASTDFDNSIDKVLKELATTLEVDRAHIFKYDEQMRFINNTNEWCVEGVKRQKENLQNLPVDSHPWWHQQCRDQKPIVLNTLEDLPPEASDIKASLNAQGVKSLLVYPISVEGTLYGFIGIDVLKRHVQWNDTFISFLNITSEVISNIINRKNTEEKLQRSYQQVSLTLKTAHNGILMIDKQNTLLLHNERFLEIWKLNSIEDDVSTIEHIFERVSYLFSDYDKYLADLHFFYTHKELEKTYFFDLIDGRTIEIITKPIYQDLQFKGNSISFLDVTERSRLLKELKLSDQVFQHTQEGILITDSGNRIIKVNEAFKKLTSYSEDEVVGKTPSILKSRWHDKAFYKALWATLKEEKLWEGEISDRRKNGELYITYSSIMAVTDEHDNVVNYIGISRDITKIKEQQERIKSLAFYDLLTGLPNRTLFYDRLLENVNQCNRESHKLALLFIDLDHFKSVNDTYGHHAGDLLLKEVGRILSSSIRQSDTVSRLAGDEFTIILRKIKSKEDVVLVADKIIDRLKKPVVVNNISLDVGSSIGAAIYPDDAQEIDHLIKLADGAMYKAKQNGKNRLEFI